MRLSRDLSGVDLARALRRLGYETTRQTGSPLRRTTRSGGERHVTIPNHSAPRAGTLAAVLAKVARHAGTTREAMAKQLLALH